MTAPYDVSLILSVHDDAKYLARTIMSLGEAASFAATDGFSTELVIVKDNAKGDVQLALDILDYSAFANVASIDVDVRSLGPCRNEGVKIANGEFVAFCDADDLISYNMIRQNVLMARSYSKDIIIFPEWLMAFGSEHYVYRMFGMTRNSPLALFSNHPFISRSFMKRSIALNIPLLDVPNSGPYAYEDWHHNTQLLAAGYSLETCPGTIFFYRKKGVSMLSSVNTGSVKAIPPSSFHQPVNFQRICRTDHRTHHHPVKSPSNDWLHAQFVSMPDVAKLCAAANDIDPAIDLRYIHAGNSHSNIFEDRSQGVAYFNACQELHRQTFSDVFLLPFFVMGGAETVIINILKALASAHPERRFLLLFGHEIDAHQWLDRLPEEVTCFDVARQLGSANPEAVDHVSLRIIQNFAPKANLYLKSSDYAYRFYQRYHLVLRDHPATLLRFCDGAFEVDGEMMNVGFDFNFLSERGSDLTTILADNQFIIDRDKLRLPHLAAKYRLAYSPVGAPEVERAAAGGTRVLWASRLDSQKRPELLIGIAKELERRGSSICIDVWGSAVLGTFDIERLKARPNIQFNGPFRYFDHIVEDDHFALLYTSSFDGVPTAVVSALAHGLPIISPSVGGLPEVVTEANGFLIPSGGEDEMIANYCDRLIELQESPALQAKLSEGSRKLATIQHSTDAFNRVVLAASN